MHVTLLRRVGDVTWVSAGGWTGKPFGVVLGAVWCGAPGGVVAGADRVMVVSWWWGVGRDNAENNVAAACSLGQARPS